MEMKKLGFGLMRLPQTNPEDWSSVDMEKTRVMIDRYMEAGFTYFDTAYAETARKLLTSWWQNDIQEIPLPSPPRCPYL